MILDCNGELFFATHSIETYLGFHQVRFSSSQYRTYAYLFNFDVASLQSDVIHQSVYELVHSEDREELQRQLMWSSFLTPEESTLSLQELLLPENNHLLERSFTVRFRCLLDNTSGFLVRDKWHLHGEKAGQDSYNITISHFSSRD